MSANASPPRTVIDPQIAAIDRFLIPYQTDTPLIRLGDFGDGGYLVPDDLHGIAACYSPGVSQQASFEMDMAKRGDPARGRGHAPAARQGVRPAPRDGAAASA